MLNNALGKKLIDNAITLTEINYGYGDYGDRTYLWHVRNHLETKYAELGINVTIPDFESYIQSFVNSGLYK
jgi:hypothetical protein